ncbi:MAG: hypothetical protein ACMXX7_01210 [Candidatus Woesearchaeota archaeon]
MKKAQIEIAGLLVIVIIISIVLFFGLLLSSGRSEEPSQAEFFDLQIASTIMPTIMESSTNCTPQTNSPYYTNKELLDVCVRNTGFICQGKNACELLEDIINQTLTKILNKWQVSYFLNISLRDQTNSIINTLETNNCSQVRRNFIREPLIIPTRMGSVIADFKLCQ